MLQSVKKLSPLMMDEMEHRLSLDLVYCIICLDVTAEKYMVVLPQMTHGNGYGQSSREVLRNLKNKTTVSSCQSDAIGYWKI